MYIIKCAHDVHKLTILIPSCLLYYGGKAGEDNDSSSESEDEEEDNEVCTILNNINFMLQYKNFM